MLKIKDYIIKKNVHIYRHGGLNIAYDVNSGSLHVLDDHTYALIEEMKDLQDQDPNMLLAGEKLLAKVGKNLSATVKKEILSELE